MAKKKAKKRTRVKRIDLQALPSGKLRARKAPPGAKVLLFSGYKTKGGGAIVIGGLPSRDPYSAGHIVFHLIQGLAAMYHEAFGEDMDEALGQILNSVGDHALQLFPDAEEEERRVRRRMVEERQAAVDAPDLGGRKRRLH